VPAEEFIEAEQAIQFGPGQTIEVQITGEHKDGYAILSHQRARRRKVWADLEKAYHDKSTIKVKVVDRVKGGLVVDAGVRAFLPASQADLRPVHDIEAWKDRELEVRVLKLNRKRGNVVVSRRAILEEEQKGQRQKLIDSLAEGQVLHGSVKSITSYGVFVDLGGIDGLLHISDISWGRITHPSEFFVVGDTVEVVVLKYDEEQERVTLGYKQKKADPWLIVDEKYPVGEKVKGKAVSIADYGAFVELEEGIEGLVHVSELDWASRPKHPSKYLTIGETVEAVVLKVDKEERRISLSIKQLKPSPWELVSGRYSVGQKISGKIRSITEFGAFVGLPEGVDGLIHISDISWTKHIKHPSEVLKKGQKVDAVVLSLEPEKERIALGLKQVTPDPWLKEIPERFKLGDEVRCRILKFTDFGIFVEIEGEVEGLIYSSEVLKREEPLKEGDEVMARIIKIDIEDRKIGLSMKHVKGDLA
jgi:small subunit ribosomal protein S1